MQASNRTYRYLDSERDRQELIDDIKLTRERVVQIAGSVAPDRHAEPRYHGWSLGAMLTHLHMMDHLSLWSLQLALLGISPPVPLAVLNRFNDLSARAFRRRLVAATIRGINRHEARIANFIMTLPLDNFSKKVYDPTTQAHITVERSLQVSFLFHWQEHLLTMQRVEGIFYEPPESFDIL